MQWHRYSEFSQCYHINFNHTCVLTEMCVATPQRRGGIGGPGGRSQGGQAVRAATVLRSTLIDD